MFKKKKEKEYIKEYVKLCETITEDDLYKQRITVMYDEIIPDLFAIIEVDNKKIGHVKYDIYADRLKKVMVKFPNGKTEIFEISSIEDVEKDMDFYTATWKIPYISINYNGLDIPLSIIDLICQDIEVYLITYDLTKRSED